MSDIGILLACVTSFSMVFLLLVFLAAAIRALTALFPEPEPARSEPATDAAVMAAVLGATAAALPGLRVTHILEER